ncbi:MAG: chromosome segregation protein SMC [Firmicutes bacterium]|nr:chromosome segregation protein SMC [Bacillota bacterium]
MLLKRLEMQGFKSFADKTVFEFVDGVTAVVGPNGSGKSNISDAIRWVIGETSAKTLRGSNMHDVIFAGTQTRKPLNFAEVTLVLDNTSHIFPVNYEEVAVTRKLFRSGESVYQINKTNCRLKDIRELFMDTGLGHDGYSIIGQGNVSQILSTKAEDRRSLFEEAAGVAKYRYRKEEAVRKLANVEENLVRINDITAELETQVNPLRRQSEKARKYLELYGEYKVLDVNMSLITIAKNERSADDAKKQYESVQSELGELREKESETEEKINGLYSKSKENDERQSAKHTMLVENEARVLQNDNEIKIAENNISNNHSMLKRIDEEIEGINKRNAGREEQIVKFLEEAARNEEEARELLKSFDAMKADSDETDKKQAELRNQIDDVRQKAIDAGNEAASQREKTVGIENLRGTYLERRKIVEAEIKSYDEGMTSTRLEIDEDKKQIAQKREKRDKIAKSVDAQKQKAAELDEKLKALNARLSNINVEYNSKSSKKKILEGMENDYAGYAKSVKTVLKAQSLKHLSIYGTLSGLIDVNKKYVTAIETALGNALQNIVVETEDDARGAIEYLRRSNGGRATFLPISSVKPRGMDNLSAISKCGGYIATADELISCDKKYADIISNLLGRTVVADNINSAIAMSKKFGYKFRIVTLEGDVTNPGGSISGGSVNKQSGFLSRAAEIKSLGSEIAELARSAADVKSEIADATKEIQTVNNQLSSYEPLMREYEDEILRLENTVEHLSSSLESSDDKANMEAELLQIEEHLKSSSDEVAELLSSVRRAENQSAQFKSQLAELEEELDQIDESRRMKSQSLMDETLKLAGLENAVKTANGSIEEIKREIAISETEIAAKDADKENICLKNDELYTEIREKTALRSELKQISEDIKAEIAEIEAEKTAVTNELKAIQASNKDLTDKLLSLQQEMSRVEARIEKLDEEKERILSRLWDDYELTYSAAEEQKTEITDEKASFERLSELKASIKSLGSVNMDSIEEYKSVKERFEFLSKQKTDLETSKNNLNKIIESMDELMVDLFSKNFEEINRSFEVVFKELFGGGHGKLTLTNPDNVLESGVDIDVQLPGKGLQNINLYSGGEKSFIAIALLFSILRVKPTPFCILDEIDAALDDVNVSRYATYLKNYVESTQFIIITHRRGSMEAANVLYGITMQEKGVSKLLSLQIDDVDDQMAN